jgi:alpha-tubulin suppressor-like RCC1 family protein
VRGIAAAAAHSFAVTQSGAVFRWGQHSWRFRGAKSSVRPTVVDGLIRVHRVCTGTEVAFAIGENGDLFSWGRCLCGRLGHADNRDQPSTKRVEALRGVRMSSVSVGLMHALALSVDGQVYAWGVNRNHAVLGWRDVLRELLPKPVEALRGVRVGSIAAANNRSYAVTDTGELWAWGDDSGCPADRDSLRTPLGYGEPIRRSLPKTLPLLQGIRVDAVVASDHHTLALAHDGSVDAWGDA